MSREREQLSRREWFRYAGVFAGGAMVAHAAGTPVWAQAQAAADPMDERRAQMGAAPIQTTRLGPNLVMLSGPGGNVAALHGPDGVVIVDTFVKPAWAGLKQALDGLGGGPLKLAIDTHWHFDHADNNERVREAGAATLAHENTRTRLTQSHDLLGMKIKPASAASLPTQTFRDSHTVYANGETLQLAYVKPAHTDTDIAVMFASANVLHMGDLYFNGMYPFIDATTGGQINGMIESADTALALVDAQTKIIPGHGPLGDKASLGKYRDVLVTVRDRVQKLKSGGQSLEQVVAAKPTKDLDEVWGKGFMQPDFFVTIVYGTL
ncbi:MAG: MBL fold metallo-hydrolase [Vicinamibacteria bacterium]|nr:MBL fold metallo-hydrolase [Vicinamibacteria bacterium]